MTELSKNFFLAWRLVARQSFAHWKLMASTMLGVLLASTILSGSVIYFDSLKELALRENLGQYSDTDLDIILRTTTAPISDAEYGYVSTLVERESHAALSWAYYRKLSAGRSESFFLSEPGDEENARENDARTYFVFITDLEKNIVLMPGGWSPERSPSNTRDGNPVIEALIPSDAAHIFGVEAGHRFIAIHPTSRTTPYLDILITGVFEQSGEYDAEFWHLDDEVLRPSPESTFRNLPLYLPETSFMIIKRCLKVCRSVLERFRHSIQFSDQNHKN